MSFFIGQTVMSKRTGLMYMVLGYQEPTLDGENVLTLQSSLHPECIVPAREETLIGWSE